MVVGEEKDVFKLDFFDTFSMKVTGSGPCASSLSNYYEEFITSQTSSTPDLAVSEWASPPSIDEQLGGPDNFYARAGDRFVIKKGDDFVSINEDWSKIEISPNTRHYFLSTLIEFKLRQRMVNNGFALVHASGVNTADKTVVFPAWLHTGKTNTMLSLLKGGGGYLSDDRVWVHRSGEVCGYPLPVNMLPYNFESFPDLLDISTIDRLRYWLSERIETIAQRDRSIFDKVALFFNQFYIEKDLGEVSQINELLPDTNLVESDEIDHLVLLRTDPNPDPQISIKSLSQQSALREIAATSYYEWNQTIEEYCRIIDSLFPDRKMTEEFEAFDEDERKVFKSFIEEVDIHRLQLPREKNWTDANVSSQIKSEIQDLA